jgi:hypothetical protein
MTEVVCDNGSCTYANQQRTVVWPTAGPGMTVRGRLTCECGFALRELPVSHARDRSS